MLAVLLAALAPVESVIAFEHVAVIEPGSKNVIRDQTVVVRGDVIVSVGPSSARVTPDNVTVVDGKGKFLSPVCGTCTCTSSTSGRLGCSRRTA